MWVYYHILFNKLEEVQHMNSIIKMKKPGQTQWVSRYLFGLAVVVFLAVVFASLAEDVWFREGFSWDAPIILGIHSLSTSTLDFIMKLVTQTGNAGAIALVLTLAGWFYWKQRKIDAISILGAFAGAVGINALLKLVFARPRPHLFPPLVVETDFSFPSGHVTAAVAVYGFIAFLLWQNRHYIWAVLSALWVLAVAFSRIYLGVHYPSDTLAAMAFTSLWLIGVLYARDKFLSHMKQPSS
jgi:undecaprenyl-diphosphatase